jgi:hypothetical protein
MNTRVPLRDVNMPKRETKVMPFFTGYENCHTAVIETEEPIAKT